MDKWNVPLGRWFGVPVYLHWSWVLLFLFIAITAPHFAPVYAGLFFLVLLHELGHSLAARHFGAPTDNITLWPFGGIASIKIPFKAKEEFWVAIAGPAVNFALIPLFYGLAEYNFWKLLGYYNIVLLVFNLVPAFPMDGGRILRSLLVMVLRNHYRATLIAARIGQGICILFGLLGIYVGAYMLCVIALFIFMAAQAELRASKVTQVATDLTGVQYDNPHEAMKAIERRLLALEEQYGGREGFIKAMEEDLEQELQDQP